MKNLKFLFKMKIHDAFQIAITRKLHTFFGALIALAFVLVSPIASSTGFTVYTTISPMTGLWWNQDESGWGVGLTQQYGVIFATLYTYDFEGRPTWYVASNCVVAADGCTGDLYTVTRGTMLTAPWSSANTIVTKVGTINFAFTDTNTGTMKYTINGVSGSKRITRQIFATEPAQTGRFPFDFKGIRLNSMIFNPLLDIICQTTLSFTNVSTVTISPTLVFDVIVDGVITGQVPFFISGLAPDATATATSQPVVNNGSYLACGTFTLQFSSSASQIR
ncbi:conserved hypothetical protein [Candidatus Nitrotoga sp. HW29]|uniref:hypothetical protein n=1 Tax=Candidatus Nitrotoga sp. HW29 TaxID=2886963 RepID=UPI001EF3297B|nr:hypothetical protein [Candidatus Nitrotoga sp. HW29]CAH1903368.1 conserved hypothetical protein [Candidatus Nitrotoga sp. HW29]